MAAMTTRIDPASASEMPSRGHDAAAAQQKSSANGRTRSAGRNATVFSFGGVGTIVMVQLGGTLDSFANTERTWPVMVDPPDSTVAVLPLNCAMRKRRTSFWSAVSNVIMKPSCASALSLFILIRV